MNTFVITVAGTTFNFTVAAGTTISIQMNNDAKTPTLESVIERDSKGVIERDSKSVIERNLESVIERNLESVIEHDSKDVIERVLEERPSVSRSSSNNENIYDNLSTISNITDVISTDSEVEILDTIKNITMRTKRSKKNDEVEFCRPAKHRYEKDAEGNYMCPYCDAKKKKVNTMSEHVRANHSTSYGRNEETHNCVDCGKGFPLKTRLDHHVKTYHEINYEKCPHPGCDYNSAKNASSIIQHYVRHHTDYQSMYHMVEDKCVCNECGASSKSGIMYHLGICAKSSPFCKTK
jgi:hypothetical protein